MALKVADEGIVVCGQKANIVIFLGGSVEDGRWCMGEAGKVAAVFLAGYVFRLYASQGVIDHQLTSGFGAEELLASIGKRERGDR